MKQQLYFPSKMNEQILWLANFQRGYPDVAARLALHPEEVADTQHGLEWLLYGLRGLASRVDHMHKAVTSFNKTLQTGKGAEAMSLPMLTMPEPPEGEPPRPGALTRLFKMVQIIKHSQGYEQGMGLMLGIEANHFPKADAEAPTFKLKTLAGDTHAIVEGRFRRYGRPGVWVECRRGEGEWEPVRGGVFCRATFRDDRPPLDPAQPEYRHYRLRFWDAKPFGEWSPVAVIIVG